MATREEVYKVIDTERDYQESVWPDGAPGTGDNLLLLEEYIDRARKEWTNVPYPEVDALNTVRKIAGIAVRCMERHGAYARKVA